MKKELPDFSTIAAIATPPGNGGIGIIRISGQNSHHVLESIFIPTSSIVRTTGVYESHRMYHGHIVNPETSEITDEVMAVFMRAPKSFTAENTVEIHAHGGSQVLGLILSIIISCGARLANAGEFTLRAFLNGRIDLTQAEGILEIIEASSNHAVKFATNQINGKIKREITGIRSVVKNIYAGIEAIIDFPDETEDFFEVTEAAKQLEQNIIPDLDKLVKTYEESKFMREGLKLVIAGPPNAGKSSLMNALTGDSSSIVTSVPGTTRDLVKERLNLAGTPVLVTDTAGLRLSNDEVEAIGINRALDAIKEADMVLWVLDLTKGTDRKFIETVLQFQSKHSIIVWNKTDICKNKTLNPEIIENMAEIFVSAKTGEGIDDLKEMLVKILYTENSAEKSGIALNLRQSNLVKSSLKHISNAVEMLRNQVTAELAAEDLKEAISFLDAIIGDNVQSDILDEIFSKFCIGK